MVNAVAEVNRSSVELRPCPVCGKPPRVIETIFGTSFVLCFPHAETETVETADEAIRLWNRGKLLGRQVEAQS